LDHLGQAQIGLGDAFEPAERAAAEVDGLEAGLLGEPRHDRVERHRGDDEVIAANELAQFFQQLPPFCWHYCRSGREYAARKKAWQSARREGKRCGGCLALRSRCTWARRRVPRPPPTCSWCWPW